MKPDKLITNLVFVFVAFTTPPAKKSWSGRWDDGQFQRSRPRIMVYWAQICLLGCFLIGENEPLSLRVVRNSSSGTLVLLSDAPNLAQRPRLHHASNPGGGFEMLRLNFLAP